MYQPEGTTAPKESVNVPLLPLIPAFTTFSEDNKPARIDFLVEALLPKGSLSLIAGKPKQGKSSLSRYLAVCVASGRPFLGRITNRAEVILVSLEDQRAQVDNSLHALGYNQAADLPISYIEKVLPTLDETLTALRHHLQTRPAVGLIVVDVVVGMLDVRDLNDFTQVRTAITKIHDLARETGVHIACLVHAKKTAQRDVFDAVLGSTALRAATDTNIAIYEDQGRRVIKAETRMGTPLSDSFLEAELKEIYGSQLVSDFMLASSPAEVEQQKRELAQAAKVRAFQRSIIEFLESRGGSASKQDVLDNVKGKRSTLLDMVNDLQVLDAITITGNPQVLALNPGIGLNCVKDKASSDREGENSP